MATLDKVMDLQKGGKSETEISKQLQQEGISPSEINDAINQARIKNAVSPPEGQAPGMAANPAQPPEMQQSIMQAPAQDPNQMVAPEQQAPAVAGPVTQEMPAPMPAAEGQMQAPMPPAQEAPQDQYYQETPQAYSDQGYYAPQQTTDTETISEIAEQVFIEKFEEYKKKTGDVASFKNTIQDKVDDIDERLKRIEDNITKLQQAVIGKIGEFGEDAAAIHKDLDNLHGTVSKLMNPLVDNYQELKKLAGK
ncbi:hypothetical protein HOA55_01155 [archaeon]|jgi:hypothetical protein|nr:hypothetical protein [archaeon]MBT3577804.1 hypothetical protein [archaeon]MBT6819942.1 hypothetical protein [archaeon]MBT6955850.1 hypothetical protein [archaeon]MBT7025498.1 hypothetical protein [archaeon]